MSGRRFFRSSCKRSRVRPHGSENLRCLPIRQRPTLPAAGKAQVPSAHSCAQASACASARRRQPQRGVRQAPPPRVAQSSVCNNLRPHPEEARQRGADDTERGRSAAVSKDGSALRVSPAANSRINARVLVESASLPLILRDAPRHRRAVHRSRCEGRSSG